MLIRKLFWILLLFPFASQSQRVPLSIQGSSPDFYLDHTVGAKENYYSIGRLYNCSPSVNIAPFNKLKMEDGLKIGQSIKIPLTESNFSQDAKAASDEALVPLYFTASGDRKNLQSISGLFNKVPVSSLKAWNDISGDRIAGDKNIVVGFLKVKKQLSAFADQAFVPRSSKSDVSEIDQAEIKDGKEVKEVAKKADVASNEVKKAATDKKSQKDAPVTERTGKVNNGGYFKSLYEKKKPGKEQERSGLAGIFKSTSGWEDGKYYCLFNDAPSGTIVRITNQSNQQSIYAKVLDGIPDMKQNEGLVIRLSNAAAGELGQSEGTFECIVNY